MVLMAVAVTVEEELAVVTKKTALVALAVAAMAMVGVSMMMVAVVFSSGHHLRVAWEGFTRRGLRRSHPL
jgi:hypothetical protein